LDKGADAEGEEGNGKNGGSSLGVNGEGALGGAVKSGGKFEEGAGGAEESEQDDQQGGMHDVFAEVFLLAEQAKDQEDDPEVGRDESGFVDSAGQEEGSQAKGDIEGGEDEGDFGHGKI